MITYTKTLVNAHLACRGFALDKISGTHPGQDADLFIQTNERSTLLSVMHLETLTNWLTTHLGRKPSSLPYSEEQLLSGTRITLRTLLHGRMSEQIPSLDFQTDEILFDTEWKCDIVSEEIEKKFGTFYTVSEERVTKAGPIK